MGIAKSRTAVVHVVTRLDMGGAQRATLDTVARLDRSRFDARLLCGPGGPLDDEARRMGTVTFARCLVHPLAPLSDAAAAVELGARIASVRRSTGAPLIVHTHCSKAGVLGRLAGRAARADAVVHTFHGLAYLPTCARRTAFWALERAIRGAADALLFVSRRDLRAAERRGLLARTPGYLIRSGINIERYATRPEARATMRAELGVGAAEKLVVTTANFKRVKNPMLALEAFARVAARDPRVSWLFVGDGGDRSAFEAEVIRLGLQPRVRLLGWRSDVARLLAAGDVYLLASDYEGLPRSVLEAIAAGLPVVATDAGGVGEVVDARTGVLVRRGDAEELAGGIIRMLAAPPDIAKVAAGVLAEFSVETMIEKTEALYDELLARHRPATRPGR